MSSNMTELKEQLAKADTIDALRSFICMNEKDERKSVQTLVRTAEKRTEALQNEILRTEQMKKYEKEFDSFGILCGIDEVGRGPLAGPVVAAAVILPKDCSVLYLNDSKKLSEKKREELYDIILRECVAYGIGMRDAARIDEINILQATFLAMRTAVESLAVKPDIALIDGNGKPGLDIAEKTVVKGDAKSVSIAAASILAKVTRDRYMLEADKKYPEYFFAKHKGYGTKLHYEAIAEHGICPEHRRTFLKKILGE